MSMSCVNSASWTSFGGSAPVALNWAAILAAMAAAAAAAWLAFLLADCDSSVFDALAGGESSGPCSSHFRFVLELMAASPVFGIDRPRTQTLVRLSHGSPRPARLSCRLYTPRCYIPSTSVVNESKRRRHPDVLPIFLLFGSPTRPRWWPAPPLWQSHTLS